jgi:hypothetical protein
LLEHHPFKRSHPTDKDARENKELEQTPCAYQQGVCSSDARNAASGGISQTTFCSTIALGLLISNDAEVVAKLWFRSSLLTFYTNGLG